MASVELAPAEEAMRSASWRGRRPPVRSLVEALLSHDPGAAADICDGFLARVRTRVAVIADILQPAQYEIGDRWYRGLVGLADEWRAARLIEWLVERLPPTPASTPVRSGSRCLLAMLPRDRHSLGLKLFALALQDDGWEVEIVDRDYLPAELPALVRRARPTLVGLSAGRVPVAQSVVAGLVGAIRELSVPVLVGGAAFNRATGLWQRMGAAGHGADARIGAVLARRMAR